MFRSLSLRKIMSSLDTVVKKPCLDKVIGTHNGTFHCDEALAVFLLKLLPEYGADAKVVRSRDPKVLETCDIVVDVGGVYDHEKKLYDHHQRGFTEVFGGEFTTKLSSAGLVYKHYGKEILATVLGVPVESDKVNILYPKIYSDFIEAIDGIDNGITQYEGGKRLYQSSTDLSSRVGKLNPRWNEPSNDEILFERFLKASALTGSEFLELVDYTDKSWLAGKQLIVDAFKARKEVDPSGKIVFFDVFGPWKAHLDIIEKEFNTPEDELPLYVLYPEGEGAATKWRIQAVSVEAGSFESRKALPESWRGFRDDELSKISGIDGCVFVHATGFIGGNNTKEGAIAMAKKAINM